MSDTGLAAGLGVAVAVIFAAKAPLHGFVMRVLTGAEVTDALIFAVATLVIWPQLPDRYLGPLQALNPHSIWFLVILVMALGACGHVATRALGARFGLPIAGLASGFVSSTATIGAMAGRAAKDPASMTAAVAGAAFSTVATFVQLALLLLTITRPTLVLMAPALGAARMRRGALWSRLRSARGQARRDRRRQTRTRFQRRGGPRSRGDDGRHAGSRGDLEGLAWGGRRHRRGSCWRFRRHTCSGDFDRILGGVGQDDAAGRGSANPGGDDEQHRGEVGDGDWRRLAGFCSAHRAGPSGAHCGGMGCRGSDSVPMNGRARLVGADCFLC